MGYISPPLRVSVITVCLNCRDLIEKTITSVISQSCPNIQYIIIDGGSTDGTLEVIKKYQSCIDVVVSEKDDGLYYAMNKGIRYASGDIIYFLNGGDYLYDAYTLEKVCTQFSQFPNSDILYGDVILYSDLDSKYLSMHRPTPLHALTLCGICHQALFARRDLFNSLEPFNTKFHIYADYEWLLKSIIMRNCHFQYFKAPVAYYRVGGISQKNPSKYYYERIKIMMTYIQYLNKKGLLILYPSETVRFVTLSLFLYSKYLFYEISSMCGFK